MTHVVRQFVTCPLLAVFGVLSVMGQALHLLVPHGCDPAICAMVHSAGDASAAGGCSHHHHREALPEDERDQPVAASQISTLAEHPHDCTICRFLAQRVQATVISPIRVELPDSPATVQQFFAQRILPCLEPYSARGPPVATL
jgi:hypothetical protein